MKVMPDTQKMGKLQSAGKKLLTSHLISLKARNSREGGDGSRDREQAKAGIAQGLVSETLLETIR